MKKHTFIGVSWAVVNKEDLIKKLEDIEWEDFEVKEAQNAVPKNSWETVSAFSNTVGGWLIFGVKKIGQSYDVNYPSLSEGACPVRDDVRVD